MKCPLYGASLGIALLIATLSLGACDLTELNENPNEPGEARIPYLLTQAQLDLSTAYWGDAEYLMYAQYWSQTQYVGASRYQGAQDGEFWGTYYLVLKDLEKIVEIASQEPERASLYGNPQDQVAMARILQVWIWQTVSDTYGPIPFTHALKGRDDLRPPYTPQSEVYPALIDTLTKYAPQLSGEPAVASADKIFEGDTERWKAFANGLKMRLAIRMSFADEAAAKKAFVEAYNATSFTDLSGYQNALFEFAPASSPYNNPYFENQVEGGRDDYGVSAPLLSVMNSVDDPRRAGFAQRSQVNGKFVGFPYGLRQGPSNDVYSTNNFSRPSERVAYTAKAPAILYTEAEELFMLAEAAQRGWISGSAEQYYNEAIIASVVYWGGTEAEAQAYLTQVPYDNSNGWAPKAKNGPIWTQTLGIQKWIALYMQSVQGWSVFRRLDFDGIFTIPPDDPGKTFFGLTFPVRLPYPTEEESLNQKNWTQAVTEWLGGTDDASVSVWWDDDVQGEGVKSPYAE